MPEQDTSPVVTEFVRDSGRVKFRRKRKHPVRRFLQISLGILAVLTLLVWSVRHFNRPPAPAGSPTPADPVVMPGDAAVAF